MPGDGKQYEECRGGGMSEVKRDVRECYADKRVREDLPGKMTFGHGLNTRKPCW